MAKRKENHYNNNVIIDNKVVSVSDLQTNAKSASMRFLVLVLGITLLASMVVPYLSMAAAATSTSNAFNGAVIPGYSMGGLELTAYGIDLNSWGKVENPCFVKSNYGIWNKGNLPKNYKDVEQQFVEDNSENAISSSQITADKLTNVTDKSTGWYKLTGFTNYTNNSPNGSPQVTQNQRMDSVSPIRTATDYAYWDSQKPSSNSTNDAKITVSLVPDFIVVSKDSKGKINIVKSPDDTPSKSIVPLDSNDSTRSQAYPIYIPIKALMDKYRAEMGDDSWHSFDDLFKAIARNPELLESVVNDDSNNLLLGTHYNDLNNQTHTVDYKKQAFNPYPYTMVFSITDSVTNQTVTSSIYENCEAYVYFSPTVVYQKYLQVKNEYNSILNTAASNLNSDNPDAVTVVQLGYYAAALSILESYLEEALPQDATRGYVGMSEPDNIRGNPDGSDVGQGQNVFHSSDSAPEASSFKKVTYATLMWDVASTYSPTSAMNSDCALDETNAIMDNLSVFGYTNNESMDGTVTYVPGVMVGMPQESNLNRRTNLTPRYKEDSSSDDLTEQISQLKKEAEAIVDQMGTMSDQDEDRLTKQYNDKTKQIADLTEEQKKRNEASNSNNSGIYTPVYYPIQQHKMPDNEKTYRFSILANIPYDTVINYMKNFNLAKVTLSYSSNFTSSFKNVTDTFEEGNKVTAVQKLVAQYNSGDEDTGLDLSTYEAAKSIVCSPDANVETDTGTSQDNSTEDTVQDRVDSALLGFSSDNMTSDNVHDLVDVMRALPSGKIETFYRFFNPIKSDGDDQDIFVTRVTPAVTTYFPSLLVNGYENAGGAEVDQIGVTSNVSFDYFSVPSFAPCFASHTASDTYYGSLNYELRAFYKKGFISTLSSKTNIPQVEEAETALEKENEAVKNLEKDNSLSAETMAKNIKTIFVEVKRLAAVKTLSNAYKNYKKDSTGHLNMDIVEKFYDEEFKGMFNHDFKTKNKIDKIVGSIEGNKGDSKKSYDPAKGLKKSDNYNNWNWNNSIKKYDDMTSALPRYGDGDSQGGIYDEIDNNTSYDAAISTIVDTVYKAFAPTIFWCYDQIDANNFDGKIKNEKKQESNDQREKDMNDAVKKIPTDNGQKAYNQLVQLLNGQPKTTKKEIDKGKTKIVKEKSYSDTDIRDEWNSVCNNKKNAKDYIINDKGKIAQAASKTKKKIEDNDNSAAITGIYWQINEGFGKEWYDYGPHFAKTIAIIEPSNNGGDQAGAGGLKFGNEITAGHGNPEIDAVALRQDNIAYGPVYHADYLNLIITNDYLTNLNSLMLKENAKYYWDDYTNIEKSNATASIEGDLFKDEGSSIFTAGFNAEAKLWSAAGAEITDDRYVKDVQKNIDEACKELFKDLINTAKNTQLLQQSMPSQMQNCLAWADYQNASDSEAQYQADPTDTVDINLDTNPKDDYDKADLITGKASLEKAGYEIQSNGSVKPTASVTGATNSAIQARMERGVEGSTWTSSVQPACYTITAIVARIESMQSSGVSYPYSNIYSGRLRSGADQYALLQAHVIDYTSIESGISGDLKTRVHGKPVSITNPNYGALPDFLNILGTLGGLLAEASSGFANLTGGMFEDVMWNGNGESATKVATSDNQTDDGTIDTKKYDGTGNIERKGSMWVLDSTGGQSFYTLVQSLALVLVLVSLLYIAFKNFYEYTRPAGASASIGEKDEAGKKSAAAESKILAATQLKVVMPRAIIAVFMIGLPPMSGAGFQGGNFLLLQMLSSIFNQISHVFMNLNGQSVMNLWLNTGADLLSENPGIGEYIAYGAAMFVIGAMFVVGTLAVLLADVMLISFYIIGPLMWALYVWPYNDTTSKTKKPDGIIAKLTSRMKFAWTGGRVGNKAPEGMIECYCETAMLNVMWSVIFWAITIVFTGVTGTIATDTSSTPGNTATLAGAATVSNATYAQSALMSTGNYYASASVAHADGLFNAGILPMPAWVRMLIAAALAVVVFMLMIRMASSMFKKSLGNTFRAVSIVAGGIKGAATGLGGRIAQTGGKLAVTGAKAIAQKAIKDPNTYEKVSRAAHKANDIRKFAGHQLSRGANVARKVTDTGMDLGRAAANLATGKVSGNDALQNMVNKGVRALNNAGAGRLQEDNKRRHGANGLAEEIKNKLDAGDRDGANELLANADPENKRQFLHYHGNLVEKNADGAYQLKSTVDSNQLDKAINDLNEQIDRDELRAKKHIAASQSASRPEQMRKAALEASGIDDVVNAMNILQSEDADDRTKKKMLRKVNDYNRRIYGDGAKHFDENDINDKQKMLEAAHSLRASIPTTAEQVTLMQERIGAADDYLYRIQQSRAYENGTSDIPGNVKLMLKPINDHVSSLALSSSNQFEAVQVIKHDVSKLTDNVLGECRMKGIGEENAIQEAQNAQLQIAGGSFLKSKDFIGGLQDAALGKPTLSGEAGMRQLAATTANLTLLTGDDTVANSLTNHAIVSSSNAILRRVPTGALNDEQRVIYDRVKNRNAAMDAAYKYSIPSDVYQSNMNSEMETLLASNPSLNAIISSGCSYNALLGELSRGSYSTKEVAVITQFANDSLTTMNDNSSFRKTIAATQRNVTGTPEEREENALSYLNPDNCEQNIEDINALKQVPYNNAQVTGDYYLNELNKAREDYDKIVAEREANDKAIDALFKGKK